MIKFVYQNNPIGTGDAVLQTKKLINEYPLDFLEFEVVVLRG